MRAVAVPEALHICPACEKEVAADALICEGCRANIEAHRAFLTEYLRQMDAVLGASAQKVAQSQPDACAQPVSRTTEQDWRLLIALGYGFLLMAWLVAMVYGVRFIWHHLF